MFFFLSTKMLPVVAGLLPIYLFAQNARHAGQHLRCWSSSTPSMNLPIAVWMMRSFLAEVPVEMLEAAPIDGAGPDPHAAVGSSRRSSLPGHRGDRADLLHLQLERAAVRPGAHRRRVAQTAPVFLTGFVTSQGLFLAKVCAAAARGLAAGADRRLRRPGQAGPGPVAGRGEVTALAATRSRPCPEHATRRRDVRACPTYDRVRGHAPASCTSASAASTAPTRRCTSTALMNDGKALDWGICGVGVLPQRPRGCTTCWHAQDCLYTLVVKHPDGTLRAAGDRLDRATTCSRRTTRRRCSSGWPTRRTRIVSLTITEGGYHVNQVDRRVRRRRPGDPGRPRRRAPSPRTAFGFVIEALARRRAARHRAVHRDVLRQHPGQRRRRPPR